ncbi:MAG: radical SAM protein, partial [Nitrospirae bacterium]|nr:radical SAM protein [Nitrospirota bacterium]
QITADYEFLIRACPIDVIVNGEGEITLKKVIKCIEESGDLNSVPGIVFLQDDNIVKTGDEKLIKLDDLPALNINHFDLEKYDSEVPKHFLINDRTRQLQREGHKYIFILTARGCAYNCFFCFRQLKGWRRYSKDTIERLFKYLKENKYSFLSIFDEWLNNEDHINNICELAKKYEIYWDGQGRVDEVTEEKMRYIKESNCYRFTFGIESFDATMLKNMKKMVKPEQNINALNICYKVGIHSLPPLIIGTPGENRKTIYNTRAGLWRCYLIPDRIAVAILNPYPGTAAYKYGLEKGYITDKEALHLELGRKNKLTINFSQLSNLELITWQHWLYFEAAINFRIKHKRLAINKKFYWKFCDFFRPYRALLKNEPLHFILFNLYLFLGIFFWFKPCKKIEQDDPK